MPYVYIALGLSLIVFMLFGVAPHVALYLAGYGAAVQVTVLALPALGVAIGILLGGNRSPRMEKISEWVFFPSLLVFIQLMFSTGRMPGRHYRADLELPWYTQLDAVQQQASDLRGIAGWTAVTILFLLMVMTDQLRKGRNLGQ